MLTPDDRWLVTYETAVMSRWSSESAAWVAHDRAVIQGLNPDKLAVVPPIIHPMRARAQVGHADAASRPDYAGPPFVVYSRRDTHAAAVAFWRALGLAGHRNRGARKTRR